MDSSDFTFTTAHPHLLSEPSIFPSVSSSNTGPGGDDLSLTDLSLPNRPFSLLAPPVTERDVDNVERTQRVATQIREEKLQNDIFILKKLNSALASFHHALDDTGSSNDRIARRLEQTDALLNRYINILSKSEEFSRLIFDEKWLGADADEDTLERERKEAEANARREAEERALAARQERERIEREEKEKAERERKERVERERMEKGSARGRVRAVRGTRPSVRGTRPGQAGSVAGRPSSSTMNAPRPSSGKFPSKLPKSS